MAQITETFGVGNEQVTVALPVELPSAGQVYVIDALTAPWSNEPSGSTADQTASINAQIAAIPDGVPGAPNIIRFPVGVSQGKYFTQGDLANNPRGAAGVINFTNRHHLIIEGPSREDPATFYTVSPAVPYSASVSQNQHSLRRHFWFRGCTDITVRDSIRVEGSNYTFSPQLNNGSPPFWLGAPDSGGTSRTRGYRAGWELEHAFAFDGCDQVVFEGQAQDIWGDGVYLGAYGGTGTTNMTIGAALLVGSGRQAVALSLASDILIDGVQIGTELIRPRRAAFDLEPVLTWIVERVEVRNFTAWMGNGTAIAALGSYKVDHINFHDGEFISGSGSKCQVGASDGTPRVDWTIRNVSFGGFGSPNAAFVFTDVDGVLIDNVDCPIVSTQSRIAVRFKDCPVGSSLVVQNSDFGDALWVDYLNSPVPTLINNLPVGMTARAV